MKILHTADWHLGKRLDTITRHDEQVVVLDEICTIADREAVDVIVIAGDIFDNFNPPNESIELFYKTCKRLTNNGLRPVIAIAGNHDSPERIEAPDPLARECGVIFAGFPNVIVPPFNLTTGVSISRSGAGFIELRLPQYDYPLFVLLTPFANEERLRRYLGEENRELTLRQIIARLWSEMVAIEDATEGVVLLLSHLLFVRDNQAIIKEDEGEKPIYIGTASAFLPDDVPSEVQYAALGHLHRHHFVAKTRLPIVYAGSPLAYSFNEDNQEKYVIIVEVKPRQKAIITPLALTTPKKLIKITATDIHDALRQLSAEPDALVQLSLKTETYLDRSITQPLYDAHKGIVGHIIPIFEQSTEGGATSRVIDFDDLEKMFKDYYQFKKKEAPSEAILHLLNEILAAE